MSDKSERCYPYFMQVLMLYPFLVICYNIFKTSNVCISKRQKWTCAVLAHTATCRPTLLKLHQGHTTIQFILKKQSLLWRKKFVLKEKRFEVCCEVKKKVCSDFKNLLWRKKFVCFEENGLFWRKKFVYKKTKNNIVKSLFWRKKISLSKGKNVLKKKVRVALKRYLEIRWWRPNFSTSMSFFFYMFQKYNFILTHLQRLSQKI